MKNHSDVGKNSESVLKKFQIQKNRQSFFGKNYFLRLSNEVEDKQK